MGDEEQTIINFQVSVDIKKQAEERGKKLGLTLSNYMRFLIMKDLEKQ
jgi:antitoxin component of RelBE/YafQ-DinJ toxin-antitoxin module